MNLSRLNCKRFERLSSDAMDRSLSSAESQFLQFHRAQCVSCRQSELNSTLALNMLREASLAVEATDSFNRRTARKIRLQSARDRFAYWSPTAMGAAVALVLVLAAVQLFSHPQSIPENRSPAGEARLIRAHTPAIPDILPTP